MRNAGASMNRKAPSWPTLALVFAVVITGGCRKTFPEPGKPIVAQAAARSISATPQSVGSTAAEGIDFSALVEACGAAVVNVSNASGAAALAGVQPGDIVLAVNGQPVRTAAELRETVRTGDRKIVALLVERERSQIFIPVPVEE